MRRATVMLYYGLLTLVALAWGTACATQFMAHALGFASVLGPPLFDVSGGELSLRSLSHAAAALAGAGAAIGFQKGRRRLGMTLLASASLCLLVAAGPFYSPHRAIAWGRVMTASEGALTGVLRSSVLWGLLSTGWAFGLGHVAIVETRRHRRRWRADVKDIGR